MSDSLSMRHELRLWSTMIVRYAIVVGVVLTEAVLSDGFVAAL
jgi:hypothetical protein